MEGSRCSLKELIRTGGIMRRNLGGIRRERESPAANRNYIRHRGFYNLCGRKVISTAFVWGLVPGGTSFIFGAFNCERHECANSVRLCSVAVSCP